MDIIIVHKQSLRGRLRIIRGLAVAAWSLLVSGCAWLSFNNASVAKSGFELYRGDKLIGVFNVSEGKK
ncbi:hypothetical protein I5Q16_16860 [Serratia marcescens]|nr:hypothetical protein [Serratia marcescens]